MVTLTNKTNRHLEIEDTDGKFIIINSGQTSGELDESKFTKRTLRFIKDGTLLKKEVEKYFAPNKDTESKSGKKKTASTEKSEN